MVSTRIPLIGLETHYELVVFTCVRSTLVSQIECEGVQGPIESGGTV